MDALTNQGMFIGCAGPEERPVVFVVQVHHGSVEVEHFTTVYYTMGVQRMKSFDESFIYNHNDVEWRRLSRRT